MIIGLVGEKLSGKSTVIADHLVKNYGFKVVSHADPIKNMLRVIGLTDDHISGSLKDVPCGLLCGRTPRWAMQSLGGDWGRDLIHPDLWVNLWSIKSSGAGNVVADGVRFSNEVEAIKKMGGITIKIRRPSIEGGSSHSTERHVAGIRTDHEIVNEEGDRQKAVNELDAVLKEYTGLLFNK